MEQTEETGYKVILFKPCHSAMRQLMTQGHKKIVQAVRAAMSEASTDGEIRSLNRTKHGENRLPNVEKFDLGDGYRLVVQLVDGVKKTRVFLFVGSHDDAQRWLDNHKHYRWVRRRDDRELDFVMITPADKNSHLPVDRLNFDASEDEREKPLLHRLGDTDWKRLGLTEQALDIARTVDADCFELDAEKIFEKLEGVSGYEKASLIIDLMWHANMQEWSEFRQRLAVMHERADVVPDDVAALAMQAPENSEAFITFDDTGLLDEVFSRGNLAEWMLYLHPEQKQVSERELRGPARLRGVSGSGKTCVLVHRARGLAKKYKEPILLVTLTESMRKLLERLADDLCGVERSLIHVKTMSMLAKDLAFDAGQRASFISIKQQNEAIDNAVRTAESAVRSHTDLPRSMFRTMSAMQLSGFLRSEIAYVRGRLTTSRLAEYVDPKLFQRHGRGTPLSQLDRRLILDGIEAYSRRLAIDGAYDHEYLVSSGVEFVGSESYREGRFRSILSDEVQDLSELDLLLMGSLKTPDGTLISKVTDGLFLAGDGAQSIYKRGFVLRRVGIDIVGRSFNLRKNYRNTHEILKAAFGLVSQFEFADVDEENISRPSMPDFAERHGSRPLIVRCGSGEEEIDYVAKQVYSSIVMGQSPGQVCVIAPSSQMRTSIADALSALGVNSAELRHDVDYESENVKISTIESAKGHEFSAVYIMGLVEGLLPNAGVAVDELPREASRLYVAMTRARERLVMSYSLRNGQQVSRFLNAIQSDCDEAQLRHGEFRKITA
jgi:superfamily I DNA/RNA helicase